MQQQIQQTDKKILFTGGGSAGHVTPNLALIKKFQENGWQINYIGSRNGIEKKLIGEVKIPYFAIATGKLRRYFCWRNFIDPFKIIFGIIQSLYLIHELKPNVVFSKGGFVAFPVVVAAWLNRIPVIVHESDFTVGLANKLCFPFAKKVCLTFAETAKFVKSKNKLVVTGTPIRTEFFSGDAERGRKFCGFDAAKKIILVYGGSLGADLINQTIRKLLPKILDDYQVAHVCGENKVDHNYYYQGYRQFGYLNQEFPDLMAAADFVIARAGANTVYELLALRKPHILIPLGTKSSRGDQIWNAKYCETQGFSQVIFESDLTPELLLTKIQWLDQNHAEILNRLSTFAIPDSVNLIFDLVQIQN